MSAFAEGNGGRAVLHARAGVAVLVTGTDTAVGKTSVACAIALAARAASLSVSAFKPVETGVRGGRRFGEDASVLARACAMRPEEAAGACLAAPLAPAVAADRASRAVALEPLRRRLERMRMASDLVLVEGAGGVAVPIRWDTSFLDLAESWGLSTIVVARATLGTLNHTVLTVHALRDRGIPVRAVVVNRRGRRADLAERTNPAALERLLPHTPVFVLPRVAGRKPLVCARRLLAERRATVDSILAAALSTSGGAGRVGGGRSRG